MSLVSAGFNLQIWKFQSMLEVTGKLLVYYWSLVRDFKKTWNWLEVGLSCSKKTHISQDGMQPGSCLLAFWLRLLTKKKGHFGSCLTFLANFACELEAEELFCNVFPVINEIKQDNVRRVQTLCLWGEIWMKFLHCFGAGMLFICNLHSLIFLRKSTVLPSIFLHCSNAKQILLQ